MRLATVLFTLIAVLAVSGAAPAEPLGRLFFTPAQRSALDAGKRLSTSPAASKPAAPRGPGSITLSGVVRRSDGEYTVWVNGRAVGKGGPPGVSAAPSANHPSAARVNVRGTNDPVEMRVGQKLTRSTGKIVETYQSSTGQKTPGAAAPKAKTPPRRPAGNEDATNAQASESAGDLPDER
jgi:hypothetical protein